MVMITFRNHILIKGRFAAYLHSPQANFTAPQGQFHPSLGPKGRISLIRFTLHSARRDEFHSSVQSHFLPGQMDLPFRQGAGFARGA